MNEDEIIAALESDKPDASALTARHIFSQYAIEFSKDDVAAVQEAGKWEHLEGVAFRRGADVAEAHEHAAGCYGGMVFTICAHESPDEIVKAIAEELDEITGRKIEKENGEVWGMF